LTTSIRNALFHSFVAIVGCAFESAAGVQGEISSEVV
jgi:hypothetical protein